MKRKIIYLDMDGVLADFFGGLGRIVTPGEAPSEIYEKGFYENLPVMSGAKSVVEKLLAQDQFDVYIATKPASGSKYCHEEKLKWIEKHFPALRNKVFFTPNKNLLHGDFLIDDHPERWSDFQGQVIAFDPKTPADSWETVLKSVSKPLFESIYKFERPEYREKIILSKRGESEYKLAIRLNDKREFIILKSMNFIEAASEFSDYVMGYVNDVSNIFESTQV